ncbi:hypothetical protein BLNAU_25152 [Blattamonas nauphoetae]|uniref:Uncharacterized protein n=1 Tax=Blattamonas nauphoetae TaxID=2049346 RepID=A0ABQ9WKE8_9EUKA|nr:hypothetical protein BLNAU_25152 [Blattamonas nauphoetae]
MDEETDAKDEKTTDKSQILTRTENLVSRLISREIDIGVTAFITETTPLRKEGRRKEKRCPSVFLAFDRRPFPLQRRCSHLAHHPHSQTDTPAKPVQQKLLRLPFSFDPTVGRTIASLRLALEGRVELSNVPFVWKLNVALSRPLLSCSAGTRHLAIFVHCHRSISTHCPSSTDQMRIEMEEVEFSNLNVDGSVDGKVDFSNVKNGASDAVRIFVMGAGPLSFYLNAFDGETVVVEWNREGWDGVARLISVQKRERGGQASETRTSVDN